MCIRDRPDGPRLSGEPAVPPCQPAGSPSATGRSPRSAAVSYTHLAGALYYPPAPAPGDLTATYQAVPALAGLASPFGPSGRAYLQVASDGGAFTFGGAGFFGSQGGKALNKPIVGIAATPDGKGYWEVASDGGIFTFGDAGFFGDVYKRQARPRTRCS